MPGLSHRMRVLERDSNPHARLTVECSTNELPVALIMGIEPILPLPVLLHEARSAFEARLLTMPRYGRRQSRCRQTARMRLSRQLDQQQSFRDGRCSTCCPIHGTPAKQRADNLRSAVRRAPKRRHKKTRCLRVVVSSTTQATRLHMRRRQREQANVRIAHASP